MTSAAKPEKTVVVIGAGLGGLSAAIALASEGFAVEVIEKNAKVGGKLNVIEKDGFTFDLGPTILTMPHVFRALFERAFRRFEDYVAIQPVRPHWRNFFEDGTTLDLSPDPEQMRQELRKLGPDVAPQFERFLHYSQRLGKLVDSGYFALGLDGFWDVIRHYGLLGSLSGFDIFRTMNQGVRRFVKDDKLADILNYFANYAGSSPYDAPAVMNLLPYIQFGYGVWYVRGGMYRLAEGLRRLAEDLGVRVRLNTEVEEIQYKGNRATALRLADGSVLSFDIVVSNMEVIPTYQWLIKGGDAEVRRLQKFAPSCSGLVMHLGIDRTYPLLAHHNFFYSQEPWEQFKAIYHDNGLPDDPTVYVAMPTRTDPSQAPKGCEVLKILAHVPALDPQHPLRDEDYLAFRERVLLKLDRMGLTGLRAHIVCEETWTPLDIQTQYYSNQGSLFGVVANRKLNRGFKAPQRSQRFSNLYFVGASVNPGGSMSMVALSGQLVRDKILADLRREARG
jgi:diapolycopene oxygenase